MKKYFIIIAVAICATAFKAIVDKTNATVDTQQGVSIFCYCKPTNDYEILGTAKVKGIVSNTSSNHMIELLVENAKKNFPSVDGIIVSTSNFEKAEAIKFK